MNLTLEGVSLVVKIALLVSTMPMIITELQVITPLTTSPMTDPSRLTSMMKRSNDIYQSIWTSRVASI